MSKAHFHNAVGTTICSAVTNTGRGIAFHVAITGGTSLTGPGTIGQFSWAAFRDATLTFPCPAAATIPSPDGARELVFALR